MSIENSEHSEALFPEQDVFINCKGNILFEDFEHKIIATVFLDNFLQEAYNAINEFEKNDNRNVLGNVLLNESYTRSINDILLQIDFGIYLPQHFQVFLLETLNSCIQSSVAGSIRLRVGNSSNDVKEINVAKAKTDTRKEVQCTGKLAYADARKCLQQYGNLAFRLQNGFFKYPNTVSPDILITQSTQLHLRGHCFVAQDNIATNIAEIKAAIEASLLADITIKIDGKEQKLVKQSTNFF